MNIRSSPVLLMELSGEYQGPRHTRRPRRHDLGETVRTPCSPIRSRGSAASEGLSVGRLLEGGWSLALHPNQVAAAPVSCLGRQV
jgi:hypothetical protein